MVGDYGKATLFALVILTLAVLRFTDAITEQLFASVLLIVVGYLVGNGVQALRGKAPSPVFVPKHPELPADAVEAIAAAVLAERRRDLQQPTTDASTDASTGAPPAGGGYGAAQ